MTSRQRVLTGAWLFSFLVPFLGLLIAGCGGDSEADEPPGRSGINFDLRSDEAGNLHVVYRGYAQGDLKQPDGWTRVYYRRRDAASGLWSEPLQVNSNLDTPSDTSGRFNQPRVAPIPGSTRVGVAWSLDFRTTRGVLVGLIETAGTAPQLLASTDVFAGAASWEFKQFALEALTAGDLALFWTLITPDQKEVWETPLAVGSGSIVAGERVRVGSPTGQSIAAAMEDGTLVVASSFGTSRNNLLVASRAGLGAYRSSRLSVDGSLGVTALLPYPGARGMDLLCMTAFDEERRIGLLAVDASLRAPAGTRYLDSFRMVPQRIEGVSVARSASGRQAAAWGRGELGQVLVVILEPGQAWPQAEELASRAHLIREADNPSVAFSGDRLHVIYRDLEKRGTSHRSYGPDGVEQVEVWE